MKQQAKQTLDCSKNSKKTSALYLRMPRCASTSIVNFCEEHDISYFGGRDMGFWPGGRFLPRNSFSNLSLCVEDYITKDVYKTKYVFSSVRNPYARAVSIFNHHSWSQVSSFRDFCLLLLHKQYPSKYAAWHATPFSDHIFVNDQLKVDYIIKTETIAKDISFFSRKFNLQNFTLKKLNSSNTKHYSLYYDKETKDIISRVYSHDIERFNYSFYGQS